MVRTNKVPYESMHFLHRTELPYHIDTNFCWQLEWATNYNENKSNGQDQQGSVRVNALSPSHGAPVPYRHQLLLATWMGNKLQWEQELWSGTISVRTRKCVLSMARSSPYHIDTSFCWQLEWATNYNENKSNGQDQQGSVRVNALSPSHGAPVPYRHQLLLATWMGNKLQWEQE